MGLRTSPHPKTSQGVDLCSSPVDTAGHERGSRVTAMTTPEVTRCLAEPGYTEVQVAGGFSYFLNVSPC